MNAPHHDLRLADIGQAFTFFAPGVLGRVTLLLTIRALAWLRAPLPARQIATDVCAVLTGHEMLAKCGVRTPDGKDEVRRMIVARRAAFGLDEEQAGALGEDLFDVWREARS